MWDKITAIGSICSIVALVYLIYQIVSLKKSSEITQKAINETKDVIIHNISLSEISKTNKTIQEIQNYNRAEKYELSIMRLQEVKKFLINLKSYNPINPINVDNYKKILQDHIRNISIIYHNLEKELSNASQTSKLNIVKINSDLEKLSDYLSAIETSIKY